MPEENLTPKASDDNPLLTTDNSAPENNEEVVTPEIKVEEPKGNWPENWRELISADPKDQDRLKRFTDPSQAWKSYRQLESNVSSGKYKPVLSDNPTPEELAAYRKANNIPEKPEDYFKTIPDTFVLGDEDQNALNLFAQKLHEKNASPDIFNTVMETALELIELNQQEAVDAQIAIKEQSRHQLYNDWGPAEYKVNINAISNVLQGMDPELRDRFEGATLSDGTLAFNDASFMKWFAQYVRENNPELTIMPGGGGDAVTSLEQRLEENRNLMRTPSEWFKKENAARRAEHTKLLEQYEQVKRKRA